MRSAVDQAAPLMRLREVGKRYPGQGPSEASLIDIDLAIARGERIGVVGRSGSGKSTLLNILAALVAPSSGRYEFAGETIGSDGVNNRSSIRLRRRVGYISQSSQLLGNFDVLSNMRLAAACRNRVVSSEEAYHCLASVGLADKARSRPNELSGGESQRVNIARALLCKPLVLFADEPTGALDLHTSRNVLGLMHKLTEEIEATLVLVTHVPEYATECERQLCLAHGQLRRDDLAMRCGALERFIAED